MVPKRRVRRARVRSVGAGVGGLIDRRRIWRWREWKRALPVPRGRRTIVGRTNLLWDSSVGYCGEYEIMNELVDIPWRGAASASKYGGTQKARKAREITILNQNAIQPSGKWGIYTWI